VGRGGNGRGHVPLAVHEAVVMLEPLAAERRRVTDPLDVVALARDELVEPALGEDADARQAGHRGSINCQLPRRQLPRSQLPSSQLPSSLGWRVGVLVCWRLGGLACWRLGVLACWRLVSAVTVLAALS